MPCSLALIHVCLVLVCFCVNIKEANSVSIERILEQAKETSQRLMHLNSQETIEMGLLDCLKAFLIMLTSLLDLISGPVYEGYQAEKDAGDRSKGKKFISLAKGNAVPWIKEWLKSSYTEIAGHSVAKKVVYNQYLAYCNQAGIEPTTSSVLGKIFREVFPFVSTRRLGSRNNNITYYSNIGPAGTATSVSPSSASSSSSRSSADSPPPIIQPKALRPAPSPRHSPPHTIEMPISFLASSSPSNSTFSSSFFQPSVEIRSSSLSNLQPSRGVPLKTQQLASNHNVQPESGEMGSSFPLHPQGNTSTTTTNSSNVPYGLAALLGSVAQPQGAHSPQHLSLQQAGFSSLPPLGSSGSPASSLQREAFLAPALTAILATFPHLLQGGYGLQPTSGACSANATTPFPYFSFNPFDHIPPDFSSQQPTSEATAAAAAVIAQLRSPVVLGHSTLSSRVKRARGEVGEQEEMATGEDTSEHHSGRVTRRDNDRLPQHNPKRSPEKSQNKRQRKNTRNN